jgi:hypothetical protein
MANNMIAFLLLESNDVYHAVQGTSLLSTTLLSPRNDRRDDLKGQGRYLYKQNSENNRQLLTLFSVRSLAKNTWINSNDVYIGRVNK